MKNNVGNAISSSPSGPHSSPLFELWCKIPRPFPNISDLQKVRQKIFAIDQFSYFCINFDVVFLPQPIMYSTHKSAACDFTSSYIPQWSHVWVSRRLIHVKYLATFLYFTKHKTFQQKMWDNGLLMFGPVHVKFHRRHFLIKHVWSECKPRAKTVKI